MRSLGSHCDAERLRFNLLPALRRASRPCIRRGEVYTPRHPGSELNEVKAMLSGIHSVTVRQCIDEAEDSGRESALCNEWMRQIPTAASDLWHSFLAPRQREFQDDEAEEATLPLAA
jgi:hypothetical protein